MDAALASRSDIFRRRLLLDCLTALWHVAAAACSLSAGFAGHSVALTCFGLVSGLLSGFSVLSLRRFFIQMRRKMSKEDLSLDHTLLFILGVLFFLVALYALNESGSVFFYREEPDASRFGLAVALAGCIVPAFLGFWKVKTARFLESSALRSEAREDAFAAYFSVTLFAGLLLHLKLGWWRADPLTALLMLPYIVRYGWKALQESKGAPALPDETRHPV